MKKISIIILSLIFLSLVAFVFSEETKSNLYFEDFIFNDTNNDLFFSIKNDFIFSQTYVLKAIDDDFETIFEILVPFQDINSIKYFELKNISFKERFILYIDYYNNVFETNEHDNIKIYPFIIENDSLNDSKNSINITNPLDNLSENSSSNIEFELEDLSIFNILNDVSFIFGNDLYLKLELINKRNSTQLFQIYQENILFKEVYINSGDILNFEVYFKNKKDIKILVFGKEINL